MSTDSRRPHSAIGIDFGGTTVKLGLVRRGQLIERATPVVTSSFKTAHSLIQVLCAEVLRWRKSTPDLAAVGIGVPGMVDSVKGIVRNLSNVPGWNDIPLRSLMSEASGLPVSVENDANAMAYAEWKYGAGKNRPNVVCVTLGTGVGGGLILNGRMFRGSRLGAGEIGQMSIDYAGLPGPYGNLGALEEYVGNAQIAAAAARLYEAEGIAIAPEKCAPAELAAAAKRGDTIAGRVWEDIGGKIGVALSNVIWLLNPDAIVIGGGIAQAGALLFGPIRRLIWERTMTVFTEALEIIPATLGNDAGIIGSAALALDELEGVAP